ncbi:tetratricopeptide repeat protein [Synechococcus sp. H60.1]|uniref:tetratricopeptide repeat protein n=1 Tax=unclassified Synechococcus TaxID=2626047 RepID=UPI0039C4581A
MRTEIQELLERAFRHHRSGELDQAEKCYLEILSLEPNQPDAIQYLGILAYQQEQYVKSVEWLERCVSLGQRSASLYTNLGVAYEKLNRPERAIECYQQAIQIDPESLNANFNLGLALIQLERWDEAEKAFLKVLELDPQQFEAAYFLGQVLLKLGQVNSAIGILKKAVKDQPDYLEAHLQLIDAFSLSGDKDQAIRHAKQIEPLFSTSADLQNKLGLLLVELGHYEDSITAFQKALMIEPSAVTHLNLGRVYGEVGQEDKEMEHYKKAIEINPNYAKAYNNLGAALSRKIQPQAATEIAVQELNLESKKNLEDRYQAIQAARDCFQVAISLDPGYAEAHHNLGVLYRTEKRLHLAKHHIRLAIELNPGESEYWHSLGCYYLDLAMGEKAVRCLEQAINLDPTSARAYNNLGLAYQLLGKKEEAEFAFHRAAELSPDFAEVYCNIGARLFEQKKYDDALEHLQEAIRLKPELADAYFYKGLTLAKLSRTQEAIDNYLLAIERKPNFAVAYQNLGGAYLEQCRLREALASYRKALEIAPDFAGAMSNILMVSHYSENFDPLETFLEHQRWGIRYQSQYQSYWKPYTNSRTTQRPLKIGYLSGDFRLHSVHFFMSSIYDNHNQENYQIYCYSNVDQPDMVTEQLSAWATGWRDISKLSDEKVATLIREDQIDILVDLSGHTGGTRVHVMALRPAPVQVTYLGYPDTTGMTVVDYRITDSFADPYDVTDGLNTEKLIRMPHSFLCYKPSREAHEVTDPPVVKNGFITFGCCNNPSKITPRVIKLWATILKAVPNSVLHLKNQRYRDESTCKIFLQRIGSHGISEERVKLEYGRQGFAEHYAAYGEVDIALDPFPYNGTTTTCETLWMGVPVITLEGSAHVSRVGVSILKTVDLPELIAQTEEDYVRIASTLSEDTELLVWMRRTMRERLYLSPLLDGKRFTAFLEKAYTQIWEQYCQDRKGRIRFTDLPFKFRKHPNLAKLTKMVS